MSSNFGRYLSVRVRNLIPNRQQLLDVAAQCVALLLIYSVTVTTGAAAAGIAMPDSGRHWNEGSRYEVRGRELPRERRAVASSSEEILPQGIETNKQALRANDMHPEPAQQKLVASASPVPEPKIQAALFVPHAMSQSGVVTQGVTGACIYALDPNAQRAFSISGSSAIYMGCSAVVESNASQAFEMEGSETLYLQNHAQVGVVGGWQISGEYLVDTISNQDVQPVTITSPGDPLASLQAPTQGTIVGKSHTSYDMNNRPANNTLLPGVYCGGLTIGNTNGAQFTMSPGTYIMAGGGLTINSQGVVAGSGVTVYNTSSTGWGCSANSSYTPITISGQANVSMSAPTSGALAGVVLFGNRTGCATAGSCQDQISGGASTKFNGALYFKSDTLLFSGSNSSGCTVAVADIITINGNSSFGSTGCPINPISVSVTPLTATLYSGQTQQFSASVANSGNAAVTWSISPTGAGTISASGLYTAPANVTTRQTVTVTAVSQADLTKSASATVTLMPQVSVSVTPATATLYAGQTQQYSATVLNSSNTAVTWSISPIGTGTISASGLYTAPASVTTQQTVTITATSQANSTKSASATVTLVPTVSVSVTPATATLYAGQTQQYSATVLNASNTAVTWSISPAGTGTINASGLYTAPASVTTQQAVIVKATSQADSTKSASATLTLGILNPPVANAGPAQTVYVGTKVQLDGTGSTDQTGSPLTYSWSFVSLPAGSAASLTNPTSPKPTFVVDAPGSYTTQLIVNDGYHNSAPATVLISTKNSPPVANAGPNQTVPTHTLVLLNGGASSDVDGNTLTYAWSFGSLPANSRAVLTNPTSATPAFTTDVKGSYVVQLVVNDGQVNSTPSTVTISDVNTAPVANAGVNQTIKIDSAVQLNGSGSTDVDGDSLTYRWSILSAPAGSTAELSSTTIVNPTFTADELGNFIAQLIVNDGTVDSSPTTVTIGTDDTAPIANAGVAQTVAVGALVSLDGTGSTDSDGKTLTYAWSILNSPVGSQAALSSVTAPTPAFTADKYGNYVVQLIVNDGYLSSSPSTVTISTIYTPPIADPGLAQSVTAGDTVNLSAAASKAFDGNPLTYKWSMLSEPSGSAASLSSATAVKPSFVPDLLGAYVVQLIVNDGIGDSSPKTVMITVTAPNQAPMVSAGSDQTVYSPNTVTLSGSVTDDGLPVGAPLTIQWSMISGPGHATFGNASIAATTVTFDQTGTYILQLSANDTQLTSSSKCTITYQPAVKKAPIVNAGPSQTVPIPNNLPLQGSVTSANTPVGSPTALWSVVSTTPSGLTASFANASSPTSTVSLTKAGTYVLQLTGTESGVSASSTVTITAQAGPQPPIVNAGPDQVLQLPNSAISLSGVASDPAGGTLTFQWTQLSGPATATLASPAAIATGGSFTAPGNYLFQLTAKSSASGLTASATTRVTVTPKNQAPIINAGGDVTVPAGTQINLNGAVSDDGLPAGAKLASQWTVISGPSSVPIADASLPASNAYFSLPGTYVLKLSASDGELSSSANKTVAVTTNLPLSLTLGPAVSGPFAIGGSAQLTASLKDALGVPVPGQTVNLSLSMPGPATMAYFKLENNQAWYSPDGVIWKVIYPLSSSSQQWMCDIDYVNGVVYLAYSTPGYNGWPVGVYLKSDDLGATWTTLSTPTVMYATNINVENGGDSIFIDNNEYCYSGGVNPVMSFDGGATWKSLTLPYRDCVGRLTADDSSILLWGINGNGFVDYNGTWLTSNQGGSWTRLPDGAENPAAVVVDGDRILEIDPIAGTQASSKDGGLTWTAWGASAPAKTCGTPKFRAGIVFCPGYISYDFGSTWVNTGVASSASVVTYGGTATSTVTRSMSGVTDQDGQVVYPVSESVVGNATAVASATAGGVASTSNTAFMSWATHSLASDAQLLGSFWPSPYGATGATGVFDILPGSTPAFSQTFASILFNPPAGMIQGNSAVAPSTLPFTDVIVSSDGSFADSVAAQGNGLQASVGKMAGFEAVFTGRIKIDTPQDRTYYFHHGAGFVFGVNGGATRVAGAGMNTPANGTSFIYQYPAMGASNVASDPTYDYVTVRFPSSGEYPYELDYAAQKSSFATVTGSTMPWLAKDNASYTFNGSTAGSNPASIKGLIPGEILNLSVTGSISNGSTMIGPDGDSSKMADGKTYPSTYAKNKSVGALALIGAFADANGLIFEIDAIGSSTILTTPAGATQLLLGINDVAFAGNVGSFVVNASQLSQLTMTYAQGDVTSTGAIALVTDSTSASPVRSARIFTATVLDTSGSPAAGADVELAVSGPNAAITTRHAITNASGVATFSYQGLHSGVDKLQAKALLAGSLIYSPLISVEWGNPANTSNQPPVVDAGADQVVRIDQYASLSGVVTDDGLPTGSNLTYNWDFVSSDSAVGAAIYFNDHINAFSAFSQPGHYVFRLTVSDGQYSTSATTNVTVQGTTEQNQPPAVSGTVTLPAYVGQPVTLNGIAIDDGLPKGLKLTTQWSVVSGPGAVTFASTTRAATTAVFNVAGDYVLKLTADDGQYGTSATFNLTVTTQVTVNQPPVVSAGPSQTITLPNSAMLTGSVTDDGLPKGATVTSQWSLLSGPAAVTFGNASQPTTTATFSQAGTYVLQLSASDTQYTTSSPVTITANAAAGTQNQPPVVSANPSLPAIVGNAVALNGTATDDGLPNGTLVVQWTQLSGTGTATFTNPNQAGSQVTFSTTGTYVLQLSACDSQYTNALTLTLPVLASSSASGTANQPPVVSAGVSQTITLPTSSVNLSGLVKDDGLPNNQVSIAWTELSGPAAVVFSNPFAASTQASFTASGVYLLQLSANDGQYTTTSTTTVVVNTASQGGSPANQPPTLQVSAPGTVILPKNVVTFTSVAADDGLPVGSTLTLQWSQTGGPAAAAIATPNQATAQVTFTQPGSYTFQLLASDSQLTTTAAFSVTVESQPGALPVVQISLPDGTDIKSPTAITGTVSSGTWALSYAPITATGTGTYQTFASGTGPSSGVLGTLDPSILLNGSYAIQLTTQDQWGQTAQSSTSVSVDGNLKLGNFTIAFNDLSVPLPGLPITITRTYDSRDRSLGDFGDGWRLSLANIRVQKNGGPLGQTWDEELSWSGYTDNYCLQMAKKHMVTAAFPDGRAYQFTPSTAQICQAFNPLIESNLTFTQVANGSNTAGATLSVLDGGDVLISGSVPGPVDLMGYDGNYYDATQFKLTTADGYVYYLDQQLGVTQLVDPNGNTLTLTANGVVSSAGPSVAFSRDGQGRISSIADPKGALISYAYNSGGDLISVTDRAQNKTTFEYDNSHYLTTIKDPRGVSAIKNNYDSSGRLTSTTDANGKTITYTPNLSANQEQITDQLGNITLYAYDNDGNITQKTDPLGNVTSYTYDANDNELSQSVYLGTHALTTTYSYDAVGNKLTETDPLGNTTTYTYDSHKQVLSVTDALKRITSNVYDANGNLTSTTDPNGKVTSYAYNSNGTVASVTDPLKGVTSFSYDGQGNLISQVDALGNTSTFTYDANNNKLSQTVTRTLPNGTTQKLTTSYDYDGNNRVNKTHLPDGTYTEVHYNNIGKQDQIWDAKRNQTSYTYDNDGRLIQTTYADGTSDGTTYDAGGHRLSYTDRGGHVTSYTYDGAGHLTTMTYPDASTSTTNYDSASRVSSTVDRNGNLTSYSYDDAGRRASVTDALNHTTTFVFDNSGQQTSVTDARGNTVQYTYDADGRQIRTTYADQSFSLTGYDDLGRMISKTDQAGVVTGYGYDTLGRLTSVTQDVGGQNLVTTYGYDELGNRITQTDAAKRATHYTYDQLGRRSQRTLPLGQSETYGYEANGNLSSRTDFNGKTTTYAYDAANRLLSKTPDASFKASPVTFTYTATGRRQTMADPSGVTTYNYDPLTDRLMSKQTPFGTISYTYDVAGNPTAISSSNANGAAMAYQYDQLNRLSTVTVAGQAPTTYSYDDVGNLAGYTYPNGVSTSLQYDSLNRLTNMGSQAQLGAVSSYQYTLGAAGNRIGVAELSGRTVSYGYDNLYRLTSETIASDLSGANGALGYSYDAVGNRKQITSTLAAIPASGLLNYDANDRTTTDLYDNDGDIIAQGGVQNSYDFENHLVSYGSMTFVYDGDGNRVAKTIGGVTTNYLVDTLNPTGYAQVLDELQSGAVTRSYTWGLQLVSESQAIAATPPANAWSTSWYGFDGHGSVRYLTNSTGAVTDSYTYDAFGNLIHLTGTTPNNYLYSGEQFDPDLNLYYNRARYLDVRAGRFWGMDTQEGSPFDPLCLHKYLYAHADPVNKLDRNGHDVIEALQSVAIQVSLFVQSTAVRVGLAILGGGAAGKGVVMNYLGAAAEEAAQETVVLVQEALPEAVEAIETNAEVFTEQGERGLVDLLVRTSEGVKDIYVEVKYSLPTDADQIARATKQLQGALNAGGEAILWTMKTPTAQELASFAMDGVTVLSGPDRLFNYLFALLSK